MDREEEAEGQQSVGRGKSFRGRVFDSQIEQLLTFFLSQHSSPEHVWRTVIFCAGHRCVTRFAYD